jgi:exodeoxyribonuclease VIII
MNLGVIYDESNEQYHATDAISSSMLKSFISDPRAYYGNYVSCTNPRSYNEDAMRVGRAAHSYILEGQEQFYKDFIVSPKFDKRTKAGKAAYAEFCEQAEGREVITEADYSLIQDMMDGVMQNPVAVSLLAEGKAETVFRAKLGDIFLQCRTDWVVENPDSYVIVDLKTTSSPLERVADDIIKYNYHIQAAFYAKLVEVVTKKKVSDFVFLFVEKQHPFQSQCVEIGPAVMSAAMDTMEEKLRELINCYADTDFPKAEEVAVLDDILTDWQLKKLGV